MSLNNLAMLLVDMGNIQEAKEMALQCLEIAQVRGQGQGQMVTLFTGFDK